MSNIHFLHVGKTGGTTITETLAEFPPSRPVIVHPHGVHFSDIAVGEQIFFVLRDPVERFVSGFYSRQRKGRPRYNGVWTQQEEAAFTRFATARDLAEAIDSSSHEESSAAAAAMAAIDHVRTSFYDWFHSDSYFMGRLSDVLFIGMMEHLSADFDRLGQMIGLSSDARLPVDELRTHRNPAHVDRNLSGRAVRNLMHWYREDYNFFDLCNQIRSDRGLEPSQRAYS